MDMGLGTLSWNLQFLKIGAAAITSGGASQVAEIDLIINYYTQDARAANCDAFWSREMGLDSIFTLLGGPCPEPVRYDHFQEPPMWFNVMRDRRVL
jgi:hypothetical protein